MEGSYPLYVAGVRKGTLTLREENLRTVFEADCADDGAGLYRAFAAGPGGSRLPLGVLSPEGGRLRVRRSFSKDELRQAGLTDIISGEAEVSFSFRQQGSGTASAAELPSEGWQPARNPERLFRDPVLASSAAGLQGGITRMEGEIRLLAFPYQMNGPFPMTCVFCFARLGKIREQSYIVYRFRPDGTPVS